MKNGDSPHFQRQYLIQKEIYNNIKKGKWNGIPFPFLLLRAYFDLTQTKSLLFHHLQ